MANHMNPQDYAKIVAGVGAMVGAGIGHAKYAYGKYKRGNTQGRRYGYRRRARGVGRKSGLKLEKSKGTYFNKSTRPKRKQRRMYKLATAIERINCERNMYPFTVVSQLSTGGNTNQQCYDLNHQVGNYNDISALFTQTGADKFLLERCYLELSFSNQGNAQVVMDVYECLARRDTPNARSQPEYLTDGLGDAGGSAITVVGMSPYDSPSWCQYFKILNKSRYILQAGETGCIKKNYRINKQIQIEEWEPQGSQVLWGQGKLTRIFLFIARGQTCNDSVNTTNVGTVPVKVDILGIKKYWYTWTQDKQFTNVGMSGSLGAIANHAQFIGEEVDIVETGEVFA